LCASHLPGATSKQITGHDWSFFGIKGFKKGTMQFKLKDRDVWALFNQHIASIKGFPLPGKL
jgi:hypothetical protein